MNLSSSSSRSVATRSLYLQSAVLSRYFIIEIVSYLKNGICGNLWTIYTDDSNRTVRTCGPNGVDPVLVSAPHPIAILVLHCGIERIEEPYLVTRGIQTPS